MRIIQPKCGECALSTGKNKIVRGTILSASEERLNEFPKLCIVIPSPDIVISNSEDFEVGMIGNFLKQFIVNLDLPAVYITTVCQCRPPGDRSPSVAEIRACSGRLAGELEDFKYILYMGSAANVKDLPLNEVVETNGVRELYVYHPNYIIKNSNCLNDIYLAVERLMSPLATPEKANYEVNNFTVLKDLKTIASVDIETVDIFPVDGGIRCIGLYSEEVSMDTTFIYEGDYLHDLSPIISNVPMISHNSIFEFSWFKKHGVTMNNHFDTMLAYYALAKEGVLNEKDYRSQAGLKTLSAKYLQTEPWEMDKGNMTWQEIPTAMLYPYLAQDCINTFRLYKMFDEELKASGQYEYPFKNILMANIPVLSNIWLNGLPIDLTYVQKTRLELRVEIAELRKEIEAKLNAELNLDSPQQLVEALNRYFTRTGYLKGTGIDSTSKFILENLKRKTKDPIIDDIIKYRYLKKLDTTYLGQFETHYREGRVHTSLGQVFTATGRLSSFNPGLQNIPKRAGPIIRNAVVAPEGKIFIEADYKSLEPRIAAYESNDRKLIDFLNSGRDVYNYVGGIFWSIPENEVTKEQRDISKTIFLGWLYGRSAWALSEAMEIPIKDAERILNIYETEFEVLTDYMHREAYFAMQMGYVTSYFNRVRRFPIITSKTMQEIGRQGLNAPIQGTASDICTEAGRNLHSLGHNVILFIHDAIVIETIDAETNIVLTAKDMQEEMTKLQLGDVKLEVEITVGKCWGKMQKLEDYLYDKELGTL